MWFRDVLLLVGLVMVLGDGNQTDVDMEDKRGGLKGCCRPAIETDTTIEYQTTNGIEITAKSDCKLQHFPCRSGPADANGGDLQAACAERGCYFARTEECDYICPSDEGTPDALPQDILQSTAEGTSHDVDKTNGAIRYPQPQNQGSSIASSSTKSMPQSNKVGADQVDYPEQPKFDGAQAEDQTNYPQQLRHN